MSPSTSLAVGGLGIPPLLRKGRAPGDFQKDKDDGTRRVGRPSKQEEPPLPASDLAFSTGYSRSLPEPPHRSSALLPPGSVAPQPPAPPCFLRCGLGAHDLRRHRRFPR